MYKRQAFDYSKWDHLDSDSDAETIEHNTSDNVWAAPPPNDAVDAARFVILCASLSSYGLCGGATWTEADVRDCLAIARLLRSSSESSWLLKPREGEIFDGLRAAGPRYAFLLRDAFQHHISLRPSIATGLRELAFSDTTGKASANDGGVALVALASLCGDVNLRDVGCTQILRKEARLALPALADLARALGHGGKGDVPM